jgi:outer membrane protein assembly factor BamD (BamD/ComL family)
MLRPKKKLHRKEIKEDALVTRYFQLRQIYDQYRNTVNTVVIVLLALVLIGLLMGRSRRKTEIRAQGELGVAQQSLYMNDPGLVIQKMDAVTKKFAGTRAAGDAVFFAANALFETGDMKEADRHYALYLDKYGENPNFCASSLAGRAAVAETEKRNEEAAQFYAQAANRFDRLYTAPFYLKESARCSMAAGDVKSAKTSLEALEKRYPESQVIEESAWMRMSM